MGGADEVLSWGELHGGPGLLHDFGRRLLQLRDLVRQLVDSAAREAVHLLHGGGDVFHSGSLNVGDRLRNLGGNVGQNLNIYILILNTKKI